MDGFGAAPGRAKNMGGYGISVVGRPFLRHDGTVGTDGRREGRGWHRADRRASRRPGGRAGPGAQGGPSSPARRAPWCPGPRLPAPVEPPGTGAGRRGRQPWPAEAPPGTRPARCWPDLSDVACEDACHGSLSARDLVGCRYRVPDACDPRGPPPPPGGERRREGPARRRSRPPRGGRPAHARRLGGRRHDRGGARPARGRVGLARPRDAPGREGQPVAPRHEVPPGEGRRQRPRRRDLAGRRQAREGPLGPAPLRDRLARRDGPLQARGRAAGPAGRARGGAEPRPPCARGQAPLPDRQAHPRLREGALPRHREGGECASPPCSPAPTCPCAPGPGGRGSSWGPPWRPPDGGRGDCVPRGRPEGPREGPGTPGKAAAVRI